MKKMVFAIFVMLTSVVHASGSGVVMEYAYDEGNGKDSGKNSNAVSIAPYIKFGDDWTADIKLDTSRDTGQTKNVNKEIKDSIMTRLRKDYRIGDFKVGMRLGIGERYTQKADYPFYTVEPMVYYYITSDWNLNALYRYRNSFDTNYHYSTDTYKIGTSYKVTKNDEVGIKYTTKYGDSQSNGFELTYARGF